MKIIGMIIYLKTKFLCLKILKKKILKKSYCVLNVFNQKKKYCGSYTTR